MVLLTALVSVGGVFIFWKVHKKRKSKLELQRRQQREHWPRLTVLNVWGISSRERLSNLGSNDPLELSSEPRPPAELESQRPAAEMPQD